MIVYKGLLLRIQAAMEKDAGRQKALLAQATALQEERPPTSRTSRRRRLAEAQGSGLTAYGQNAQQTKGRFRKGAALSCEEPIDWSTNKGPLPSGSGRCVPDSCLSPNPSSSGVHAGAAHAFGHGANHSDAHALGHIDGFHDFAELNVPAAAMNMVFVALLDGPGISG